MSVLTHRLSWVHQRWVDLCASANQLFMPQDGRPCNASCRPYSLDSGHTQPNIPHKPHMNASHTQLLYPKLHGLRPAVASAKHPAPRTLDLPILTKYGTLYNPQFMPRSKKSPRTCMSSGMTSMGLDSFFLGRPHWSNSSSNFSTVGRLAGSLKLCGAAAAEQIKSQAWSDENT